MSTSAIDPKSLSKRLETDDIVSKASSRPIYLSTVEINGGETFSSNFFLKLLNPLITKSDYTLSQLVDQVEVSKNLLNRTNVFKSVDVTLTSDYQKRVPNDITSYNKETSIPTKVIIDLKPIDINIGEGFLNFNNEDYLNVDLNYLNNNFNNNAESINIGVNYNPYKPTDHLFTNGRFVANLKDPSIKFVANLFHSQQNNETWQLASENVTGGVIGLQFAKTTKLSVFTGFGLTKRSLLNINDGAQDSVKLFAGNFLKTSIINQIIYSNNIFYLDQISKNFITSGLNSVSSIEVSSNQENDDQINNLFAKGSWGVNCYKSFLNDYLTTKISGNFGAIYNLSNDNEKLNPIHVSDRFYLGGINSFKGFQRNSININGGSQFFKLSGTIYSKLPKFIFTPKSESNPLRLYWTEAIGAVSNNLAVDNGFAVSRGFGVRYFNHWANFDIGYFFSERIGQRSDSTGTKDGLHFEVSIGGTNRTFN